MPSTARSVATAAAPSQVSAAGAWPPWWRQGWKWSETPTISSPIRSACARVLEQLDRAELLGRRLVAELHAAATGSSYGAGGSRRACRAPPPAGPPRAPPPIRSSGSSFTPWYEPASAADRLLHQRPAEVVHAPVERLGGGVEPHLHPARLEARDRPARARAGRPPCASGSPRARSPRSRACGPSSVWKGMNESGTNSVKPPVRSCSSRTTRMCSASSQGSSMWPNITVTVVRTPGRVARPR